MSTRCNIHFTHGDYVVANVYRHADGYPGDGISRGVLADLGRFFTDVETQCSDTGFGTRFDDPSYLASKFVVWQSMKYSRANAPLEFGGVGVVLKDAVDGEYVYSVDCRDEDNPPVVTWSSVRTESLT